MRVATETDQVIEELRAAQKLLLTTHENPDGDALGSLTAMHWILQQIGKDSVMYMSPEEFPLSHEYRHMTLEGLLGAPPEDIDERTVVFLDCCNIDRMPVDFLQRDGIRILNIDHHHDNTRFGTVNLVVPQASCTAEIVFDLAHELGAEVTPPIADALYVGLVTDTGKFMYENTTPAAHRMAAELIEAGVDTHAVYRRHFEATGALESDSEGVVDHLRTVGETKVAVLVRELLSDEKRGCSKVSMRSTDGQVDVSRIARTLGGGGHRPTEPSRGWDGARTPATATVSWSTPAGRPPTRPYPPASRCSARRPTPR